MCFQFSPKRYQTYTQRCLSVSVTCFNFMWNWVINRTVLRILEKWKSCEVWGTIRNCIGAPSIYSGDTPLLPAYIRIPDRPAALHDHMASTRRGSRKKYLGGHCPPPKSRRQRRRVASAEGARIEAPEALRGVGCGEGWLCNLEMVYFGAHLRYSDVLIIGLFGFNNAYLLSNQNVGGTRPRFGGQLPPLPPPRTAPGCTWTSWLCVL